MPKRSDVNYIQLRKGVRLEEKNGRQAIIYGDPENPMEILYKSHEDFEAARTGKPRPSVVRRIEAAARQNEFENRQAMLDKLGPYESAMVGTLWDIYNAAAKKVKQFGKKKK